MLTDNYDIELEDTSELDSTIITNQDGCGWDDDKDDFYNDCIEEARNSRSENQNNLTFERRAQDSPPKSNSDGYIPEGTVTLERDTSGLKQTFKLYEKGGNKYVYEGGRWIRIDGIGIVEINGVDYEKIRG